MCTSFSIFKVKSDEEQAEDRSHGLKKAYNRKLVPILSRHGGCLDDGDYINIMMDGQFARLTEGPTRNEIANGVLPEDGFEHDNKSVPDLSSL